MVDKLLKSLYINKNNCE